MDPGSVSNSLQLPDVPKPGPLEPVIISNPLPQRYLTDGAGVGGRIKVRPEDFLVDELPLYEPTGQGEHLYLGIEKSNVSHAELMSCLRRTFRVKEGAIGFAGMKDKAGITRQTVSIHLLSDPPALETAHSRVQILWAARHRNKLKLGHLAGNRFSIRIREVDPLKAPLAHRVLRALEQAGVPNYFGSQRFGYRRNNHLIGAALLREDWTDLAARLLGTRGGTFPAYQRQRRELFDAGRFEQAAALWTAADRAERIVCSRLAAGKRPRDACLAVGSAALAFWISAQQSAVFNRVLDRRIEQGTFAALLPGDVAFKHATRGMFHVTDTELASDELPPRLQAFEISPSGPLWGKGMMRADGQEADLELEALRASGLPAEALLNGPRSPEGGRRPLRVPLRNSLIESGMDEHGSFIRVAFDLPRGAYATVVLREIMKADDEALLDHPDE